MRKGKGRPEIGEEEARRIAAEDLDRSLFVEAGAGTGKTTLLVERILNILRSGRARLTEVVAITFTEKAAGELLHRLRAALEEGIGREGSREARRNLEQALLDVERAPISTIHGFAGQLLRERPLEAGIDPGFSPLDGVSAALALEDAWEEWLPGALTVDPRPALRARRLGVELEEIRELGAFILENRDRSAREAIEPAPPPDPAGLLAGWERIQERLEALAEDCEDPRDGALLQIGPLRERLGRARRLLSGGRPEELESLLLSTPVQPAKGNQKNWASRQSCAETKALLGELSGLREGFIGAASHEAIRDLAAWLSGFADFALAERRARGLLTFQDYLIECRDLLRRDRAVRAHFQGRYRYILLDEFQDTDPLQLEIAFFLAEERPLAEVWDEVRLRPGKLFIVGDPKQSIYRFRRADVELYERIKDLIEPPGLVLSIRRNFRSSPRAIEWVNRTFGTLIHPPEDGSYQPEYLGLVPDRPPEESTAVLDLKAGAEVGGALEARRLEAEKLARLLAEAAGALDGKSAWTVRDRKTKELRTARFRDIAVLFPTLTGIEIYEEALRSAGIPYHLDGGKEFFRRHEVAGVLHALDALDRPEDELALACALRSAVLGHADAEIVELIASGGRLAYLAEPPASLREKPIAGSLAFLRDLHRERNALSMAGVLGRLIDSTGAACAAALRRRGGLAAAQNLRKLQTFARRFDEGEGAGATLGRFARWLSRMAASDSKEAESPTFEENDEAVRLLTIHKAKGLEFPVVVLINLGSQESFKDRLLWSGGRLEVRLGGEGDPQTAGFDAARERESLRQEAERIRLLYVASTRARDRLVISRIASGRGAEGGLISHLSDHPGEDEAEAAGPLPALRGEEGDGATLGDLARLREEVRDRPERIRELYGPVRAVRPSDAHAAGAAGGPGTGGEAVGPPGRTSEELVEREAALAFGRAVHRALEEADLHSKPMALKALCVRAAAESGVPGRAEEVFAAATRALATGVLERARCFPCLRREVPFQVDLEEGRVAGAIDLVFEEDGGFTIVDFKTDRVERSEVPARAASYAEQVRLYARAIERITGKEVRRAVLVFTANGAEEAIPL